MDFIPTSLPLLVFQGDQASEVPLTGQWSDLCLESFQSRGIFHCFEANAYRVPIQELLSVLAGIQQCLTAMQVEVSYESDGYAEIQAAETCFYISVLGASLEDSDHAVIEFHRTAGRSRDFENRIKYLVEFLLGQQNLDDIHCRYAEEDFVSQSHANKAITSSQIEHFLV